MRITRKNGFVIVNSYNCFRIAMNPIVVSEYVWEQAAPNIMRNIADWQAQARADRDLQLLIAQ